MFTKKMRKFKTGQLPLGAKRKHINQTEESYEWITKSQYRKIYLTHASYQQVLS